MATPRMRRINEVLREVVGAAISTELSDPRIGFVTVTSVETSPDLRTAKVHVSVLGDEGARESALAGLRSSHGVIQSKIAAETRMKRTPTVTFHYDPTVEQGMRISRLLEEERVSETTDIGATAIERVAAEIRDRDRFLLTAHEGPDGDALGSLLGMHHLLTQLGKDSVMFLAAKEFPLPIEYRFLPLEEVFHEPPADMSDRTVVFLDCGNLDRMPVDFLADGDNLRLNIDHHHDNTLFGDVNLVDVEASCTAEIVYELAILLGAEDHAGDGFGPLRRPRHRHRQVHVREHQRPNPPNRGGADRSGRRRSTRPTAASTSMCRSRSCGCSPSPSRGSSTTATALSCSPTSPPPTTRRAALVPR